MKNVFLKPRNLPCCSYTWVSSDNFNFVIWFKRTILRWQYAVSCSYYFCIWNNDAATKFVIGLTSYSYMIRWIISGRIKKISLPWHFTSFYLSTTKNFVDGGRNIRAKRWYFMTSCIKNIMFVSKRFCDRSTLFTPWIKITIIPNDVWNRVVLGDAQNNFLALTTLNWISSIAPWSGIVWIGNSTEIVIWNLMFFTTKRGNHPRIRFMRCCRCPFLTSVAI